MTTMKQFLLLLLAVIAGIGSASRLSAQTLRVYLQNGETLSLPAATVDSIVFKTDEPASPTFHLTYSDVTAVSAHLRVEPSDQQVRYYYDIVTLEDYQQADGDVKSIIEGYIASILERLPGMALEQVLEIALSQGTDEDDVRNLPSDTEFVFYAMAVGDDGKCYGEAATTQFRTLRAGNPADCTFTLSYSNLTSTDLTVNVQPSDPSVRYWVGVTPVAGYSGDFALMADVKSAIEEAASANGMTVSDVVKAVSFCGQTSYEESGLEPSTPYYIYAYAMGEDGAAAGSMTKLRFTTTDYDRSSASVSLSYRYFDGSELAETDAQWAKYAGKVVVETTVTPSDDAEHWVLALASGDLTDEVAYPEDQTKQAMLQAGSFDVRTQQFVATWGKATFLAFAADAAGVDGALLRQAVEFDSSGVTPASEYGKTTRSLPAIPKQVFQVSQRLRCSTQTLPAVSGSRLREKLLPGVGKH